MSFRHSNTSQGSDDFHGLKESIAEADYGGDGSEEKKDKRKEAKKFLFKKDSKDKGYSTLSADQSQDSVFLVNTKNSKKPKHDNKIATLSVFKKSFKDDKRLKDIKESKEVPKRSKKNKERNSESHAKEHLFGNYLENSVISFPCSDGVRVPYPIRICMDIIEQKEIESEHVYRKSINKSQLESICDSINSGKLDQRLDELNSDPNLACYIIKKYLRELKSPLVSDEFVNLFDKCDTAISDKDVGNKVEQLKKIVSRMPQPNFDTFSYLIMHFHRVLNKHESNKIEIGFFVQKFQAIFRVKERLFKFIIIYADSIFREYRFKRYRTKTNDETMTRFSMLPDNIEDLEQEISKQEIYLAKLHSRIANEEKSTDKTVQEQLCEELWALQRYVTSLKRKVKKLKQERKLIESEQMNILNQAASTSITPQVPTSSSNSTIKNEESSDGKMESGQAKAYDQPTLSTAELYSKETSLICENSVLTESIKQLLDKMSKEKLAINDLQQKLISNLGVNYSNFTIPMPDTSKLSLQELIESDQSLNKENKLLEERIHLINKRINAEKEKIFELKLSIHLKQLEASEQHYLQDPTSRSIDLHLYGKINLAPEAKELVMTKL